MFFSQNLTFPTYTEEKSMKKWKSVKWVCGLDGIVEIKINYFSSDSLSSKFEIWEIWKNRIPVFWTGDGLLYMSSYSFGLESLFIVSVFGLPPCWDTALKNV